MLVAARSPGPPLAGGAITLPLLFEVFGAHGEFTARLPALAAQAGFAPPQLVAFLPGQIHLGELIDDHLGGEQKAVEKKSQQLACQQARGVILSPRQSNSTSKQNENCP